MRFALKGDSNAFSIGDGVSGTYLLNKSELLVREFTIGDFSNKNVFQVNCNAKIFRCECSYT